MRRYQSWRKQLWWSHWYLMMLGSQPLSWRKLRLRKGSVHGRIQSTSQWKWLKSPNLGLFVKRFTISLLQQWVEWIQQLMSFFIVLVKKGKKKEKTFWAFFFCQKMVFQGSSKSGFLGEASIDFADFLTEAEPLTVSLPLKFANSGAVLNVNHSLFSSLYLMCIEKVERLLSKDVCVCWWMQITIERIQGANDSR